jgi:hypothetical protein
VDDSLLLSLDFPPDAKAKDCYRLLGPMFKVNSERRRVCSGVLKSPTLAVAVCQQGSHAIVAVLCMDGAILPSGVDDL